MKNQPNGVDDELPQDSSTYGIFDVVHGSDGEPVKQMSAEDRAKYLAQARENRKFSVLKKDSDKT